MRSDDGQPASWLSLNVRSTCSALAMAAVAVPSMADAALVPSTPIVYAEQTYQLGGPPALVSDSSVADVLPYFNVGANSVFGHTYAYPSGTNGSRSSGTNTFVINGKSTYTQTWTNDGLSAAPLKIDFEITYGEVGLGMAPGAVGSLAAGVEALITLGSATFDFKADMGLVSNGTNTLQTFALSGPSIGGPALPATTPDVWSGLYDWGPYGSSITTSVDPGETVTFLYTLTSYASGSISDLSGCTGTGIGGEPPRKDGHEPGITLTTSSTSEPCYNYAIGRIGDPFHPDFVPQFVVTPEPMTLTVFGAGLVALAVNRRRRP